MLKGTLRLIVCGGISLTVIIILLFTAPLSRFNRFLLVIPEIYLVILLGLLFLL